MNFFMGLIVLGTAIWMAVDASQLGYDKRDIKGIAAMGPVGWFFCGWFLWIIAFPLYLIKRPELKAAGELRKQGLTSMPVPGQLTHGYPPPQGYPYPQPSYPQPPYPQAPYPHPNYPQAPSAPLSADAVAESIVKLGEMRDAGLLTDAEFQQQKAQLLARMT